MDFVTSGSTRREREESGGGGNGRTGVEDERACDRENDKELKTEGRELVVSMRHFLWEVGAGSRGGQ